MKAIFCPYCGSVPVLVCGAELFPGRRDMVHLNYWACRACDAHVGCLPGTTAPRGTLANAALRRARVRAHEAFDPLWDRGGRRSRTRARAKAYEWLCKQMGLYERECHIGQFTLDQCNMVVQLCEARRAAEEQAA